MAKNYDVIIIGSGPGGYVAGIRAGQLGLTVGVVERDPFLGGTCLHRGCIPTKALLHSATVLEEIREAGDLGIGVSEPSFDINKAHERKQGVVDKNARGIAGLFKKYGVDSLQGFGKILEKGKVEVTDDDGGSTTYETKNIVIATGSVPRSIPVVEIDGEKIINSDHILKIGRVPKSMVVLGAGAVGTEFASMFTSFGTEVTLVEMLDRLLPMEDEEVSKELQRSFRKRGITAWTGTKLTGAETTEDGVKVSFEGKDDVEAEVLLVAVGRAPFTEGLGLDNVGIELDEGYVETDEWMRTGVDGIYAIGDVVKATPWLAHKASAEGILAVEHIAGHEEARPLDYTKVPSVVFTDPEVGSIGLTEAQAKEQGYDVQVGKMPFLAIGKAVIEGKTAGFVKVVRDKKYDEVLGVHIIGPHATDLISEASLGLAIETTAEEIFRAIHAHPTLGEAMAEAAHASHGAAIHF